MKDSPLKYGILTVLENLEEFSQKIKNNPSALIREPAKTRRK